jgi:predicted transcriptional regulator
MTKKRYGKEITATYTFKAEPRLMEKLTQYAKLNDTTRSRVINYALENYSPIKKWYKTHENLKQRRASK